MKLKKVTSFIAVLGLLAVMFTSCAGNDKISSKNENSDSEGSLSSVNSSEAENQKTSDITPAMWVCTAPNGSQMTLIGSMHALKDETFPLPDKIMDAYNSADILAVECDTYEMMTDINSQMALASQMFYDDGTTLKDHITKEAYEALSNYLKSYSMDISALNNYKTWAISSTVDSLSASAAQLDAKLGLDSYFLNLAHNENKEIYEVESMDFQMDMLMNFSDDIYSMLFESYKDETKDTQAKALLECYDLWSAGKIEKLLDTFVDDEEEITAEEKKIYDEYLNIMLYDRNVGMEKAVKKFLDEKKNVFFVVGAAHFAGDKGIISLLENDGYKIERVEY